MDSVLSGHYRDDSHWLIKDVVLTSLLAIAVIGLFYARRQNAKAQESLKRLMLDMESLASAESALKELQEELQQRDSKIELLASISSEEPEPLEVSQLKEEVEILRSELQVAEIKLEDKCWAAHPVLQSWLQLTYELESQGYNVKRKAAEEQLEKAKAMCEKLKQKKSSLLGAFVNTHGMSIEEVDRSILESKTALMDLTKALTERSQRWQHIEALCGCHIVKNPGIPVLQSIVKHVGQGYFENSSRTAIPLVSQDDMLCGDEFDANSVAASHATAASSHMSHPSSSLLSLAIHQYAAATSSPPVPMMASSASGHTRRRAQFKSMRRQASKDSTSSEELDRTSRAGVPQQLSPGLSSARSSNNSGQVGLRPSTPPVRRSSLAAMKQAKMMQKSLSQDAGASIQHHHILGASAMPGVSVFSSISDGHLHASANGGAASPWPAVRTLASISPMSVPSSSSSLASLKDAYVPDSDLHLPPAKPGAVDAFNDSFSNPDVTSRYQGGNQQKF